jgi:hypothetical protein
MASATTDSLRARREAVVNAHIQAEAVEHDVTAGLATFYHPRYEVQANALIADSGEAAKPPDIATGGDRGPSSLAFSPNDAQRYWRGHPY